MFDVLHRQSKVTQQGQVGGNTVSDKRVDFVYNAIGQFTSIKRYDDLLGSTSALVVSSAFGYNDLGKLKDLTHSQETTVLADYDYSMDALSRITEMSFTSLVGTSGSSDYTYDAASQLTSADHDYMTDEDYSFDGTGNRTMTDYVTGSNNLLTGDGTFTYEYDDEGNRTKKTHNTTSASVEYTWDQRNRLTKIVENDSLGSVTKQVDYTYDLFDRRIEKSVDADGSGPNAAVAEHFAYDGADIVLTLDVNADVASRLLHGPAIDQVLVSEDALGDILWPLADHLGSVRDIIDSEGNVENHILYNSFGEVVSETDSALGYLFGFTGRERDVESDLQFNRARYYDAAVGRWISEDPIGFAAGDTNLNRYVGNGPVDKIDPWGMEEHRLFGDFDNYEDLYENMSGPTPTGNPRIRVYESILAPVQNHKSFFGIFTGENRRSDDLNDAIIAERMERAAINGTLGESFRKIQLAKLDQAMAQIHVLIEIEMLATEFIVSAGLMPGGMLNAPARFRGLSNGAVNQTISAEQQVLLRRLFNGGSGTGLTRGSLEAAREISRRALLNSATSPTHILRHRDRLQQIADALGLLR
jgi:RHS repeat-associated protein